MNFIQLRQKFLNNFAEMSKDATHLFEVEVDTEVLWNLYLDTFPEGYNRIFRERREHDCSCCRHFVKTIGNAVTIKDNIVRTIWDLNTDSEEYQPSFDALSNYIKSNIVTNVFISKEKIIGTEKNRELLESGDILTWEHYFLNLPDKFVINSNKSIGDIKGTFRDSRNVFKRSLDEISEESLLTVLELISSNTLYKGQEWKTVLMEFLKYKKSYDSLKTISEKENYTWEQSVNISGSMSRIKNHSIGTLLINISEGMELDLAVKKYESIVAPSNYKRPKAIFTKKMLEDAKKTMMSLGYMDSLQRRFATLDDITVNNILFSNRDSAKRIDGLDIFDEMSNEISTDVKKFSRIDEIGIEEFIKNVLPIAKELEVFLENKHSNNMVSLIAPEIKESKTMFKWNNNFGWAYSGNITDSSMKDRVKTAGGKVDGDLRFSLQWNDVDGDRDNNDLDAHCIEKFQNNGYRIYYPNSRKLSPNRGVLDVDNTNPNGKIAVENITYANRDTMKNGTYEFLVHGYSNRGGRNGFRAEIEFDGKVYSYDHPNNVKTGEFVSVAIVTLKDGVFTINEKLTSAVTSKDVWNVKTNQFVPVSVVMNSPNYWDEQSGIGHNHYMFMLKDCVNSELPNGFYNEFLKEDLMKHKKVFEALGGKMAVKDVDDQLSGLGFSSTKRNDLIIKVKGSTERVLKIKF